jgi:hypothetical protein
MVYNIRIFSVIFLMLLLSCEEEEKNNSISYIEFEEEELFITGLGVTIKLYPIIKNSDGESLQNKELLWTSENDEVAVIDEEGNLTTISIGTTQIIVSGENKEAKVMIHVCGCVVDRFIYDSNDNILEVERNDTVCNQIVLEYFENGIDYEAAIENNIIDIDSEGKIIRLYQKVCGF